MAVHMQSQVFFFSACLFCAICKCVCDVNLSKIWHGYEELANLDVEISGIECAVGRKRNVKRVADKIKIYAHKNLSRDNFFFLFLVEFPYLVIINYIWQQLFLNLYQYCTVCGSKLYCQKKIFCWIVCYC